MNLDEKQQVLLAVYAVYQTAESDMSAVRHTTLDIDLAVFQKALIKLGNEEYISGLEIAPPGTVIPSKIKSMKLDEIMPTRRGVEYAEILLGIDPKHSGGQKLETVKAVLGKIGLTTLQTFTAEILKRFI